MCINKVKGLRMATNVDTRERFGDKSDSALI